MDGLYMAGLSYITLGFHVVVTIDQSWQVMETWLTRSCHISLSDSSLQRVGVFHTAKRHDADHHTVRDEKHPSAYSISWQL